jgi:hypothetical protein
MPLQRGYSSQLTTSEVEHEHEDATARVDKAIRDVIVTRTVWESGCRVVKRLPYEKSGVGTAQFLPSHMGLGRSF